jgi:tRNA-specific 2-thiouridylase
VSAPGGLILVGLSGGVDSAVAALLLVEQGHEVQGLFMSNWDEDDAYCTQAEDFQDARAVARVLGIPLHRANFAADYRTRVFENFLAEHRAGRTPNPDVLCNREVKFGVALRHARRLGARRFATGHYARLRQAGGGVQLLKAADARKDQTYFLHAVQPADLRDAVMPIGEFTKAQVRERARAAGLPVFDKPDSTGICFIGERPFAQFLSRYLELEPGPIEDDQGRVVGEHRGLAFYTLGQRSGLGLGGRAGADAAPWYVAAKDVQRNALIVVQDQDHPLLLSNGFTVAEPHWLQAPSGAVFACSVKTRYRQCDLPCEVRRLADGRLGVRLAAPARAVTPGQYAVFYADDVCLGGGVITPGSGAVNLPGAVLSAYNS